MSGTVARLAELDQTAIRRLLSRYGVGLVVVPAGAPIPGSYWGEPEAGLSARRLYARADTPAHSLLHELGHFVCMTADRRVSLWRDAGGDTAEECAVCYLQVLLADGFEELGQARMLDDMDAWGYSFRQGTAERWFHGDGRSARRWLLDHGLIDAASHPTGCLRQ
jgi:hypothetical protein